MTIFKDHDFQSSYVSIPNFVSPWSAAELLHSLIPVMDELDIDHTWKVIPLDEASNLFTAHLVDLLQGIEHGAIPEEDQRVFLDKLRFTPEMSRPEENQADIYFIHDFQLAPLATFFPWLRPAVWMSHVDTQRHSPPPVIHKHLLIAHLR